MNAHQTPHCIVQSMTICTSATNTVFIWKFANESTKDEENIIKIKAKEINSQATKYRDKKKKISIVISKTSQ